VMAMRALPSHRLFSQQAQAQATQLLQQQIGLGILALDAEQLHQSLWPLLDKLEPLPAFELSQLNTYGGLLFDRVSRQPLALLSATTSANGELAWSSLSSDPSQGLFAVASLPAAEYLQLNPDQQLSTSYQFLQDVVRPDAISAASARREALLPLVVQQHLTRLLPEHGATAAIHLGDLLHVAAPTDRATVPLRRPGEAFSAYAISAAGALSPFTYNQIADVITLTTAAVDAQNPSLQPLDALSTQAAISVSALRPVFDRVAPGWLVVGDGAAGLASAAVALQARLGARGDLVTQIGYVVLDIAELPGADAFLADRALLKARARTLFHTLEERDVTLPVSSDFTQDLLIRHGQALRFFGVSGASLEDLSSPLDPRFHWLEVDSLSDHQAELGTNSAADAGPRFSLELLDRDPDLNALIGQPQDHAPLLDFRAFAGRQPVQGILTLSREAAFDAVTGFYRCFDESGSVRDPLGHLLAPSDPGYAVAALRSDNLVAPFADLRVADRQVTQRTFTIQESTLLAPFSLVNGKPLFAFGAANTDGRNHFLSLGQNRLGLEDMTHNSDFDYDDHVMAFNFTAVQF